MDVSSLSSSLNAALTANLQSSVRTGAVGQDAQAQTTLQSESSQSSQSSPGVQGSSEAQASASANALQAQALTQSEPNRPTVNLNGQTVGTLVNTTA